VYGNKSVSDVAAADADDAADEVVSYTRLEQPLQLRDLEITHVIPVRWYFNRREIPDTHTSMRVG